MEMKKKCRNNYLIVFLCFLIVTTFTLSFVFADHVVQTSANLTNYSVDEDLGFIYNISITINDTNQSSNVSKVTIELFGDFTFIEGSNGTDAANVIFSNTSFTGNLTWQNISTDLLINNSNTSYFWFNATAQTPGTYNMTIHTTNISGTFLNNITITVNDTTSPETVNATYPINATNLTINISELNYTATDNGVFSTCWYTNNSGVWNSTPESTGTNFTNVVTAEGLNNFTVYCNDSANNVNASVPIYFTKDSVNPLITVTNPQNMTNQTTESIIINISSSESLSNCTISLDDYETNISMTLNSSINGANYTNATILDGLYTAKFWCYDETGRLNDTESITFRIDNTQPSNINITYPINATNFTSNISELNFTSTDNGVLSSCWYTNNSGVWNSSIQNATSNFTNVVTNEGTNNFTVYCNDTIGNMNSSVPIYFTKDTVNPLITVTYPPNMSNISADSIIINISSSEALSNCTASSDDYETNISMTLNSSINGANYTNASIANGLYTVKFWCYDETGRLNNTESITFRMDDTAPNTLNITYPLNGTNHTSNVSEINYSVNDNGILTACWYSNNSGIWNSSVQNASANFTAVPTEEGINLFTVYCSDSAGNVNATNTTFTKDSVNPLITVTNPANMTNQTAQNITLNITSSESLGNCTVTLDDWETNITMTLNSSGIGGNYSNATILDGLYTAKFWCSDGMGSINNTESITFRIDGTPPNTLNITYPLNGTNHTSNVSEINYSVNDNGILTACWYSNNSGIWNSSVQNASANFTSVRTREGLNNFTIYCSDSAGNENSTFTVFVKDSINPPVEIKSPVNGSIYYANQSILINMESSDSNLSILSYDWNGTQNYTFSSLTYINFTSMGLKNITFYANDTHGNMNTTLIIINVTNLTTNSYIINDSTFNVSENITKIIVPYNTSLQNVTLTNSSRNISFDLSQLLNNNIVTIGPNNFTLKTIDTFNYTAIIQANTNISGNSSWDGTIVLPRLNTTASSFTAPSGTTNAVIELGSSFELNFTSPVKIIIGGMSGKRASWSRGTTTLTDIATACDSATSPTNIDATTTRECYIDSGSDLVIWTYHFTNFAAYTLPAATTTASTGGSTSSGSTSTTYTISDSKLNSGYTKAFMKGDKARFVLFNKTHYFKVISVSDSEIEYNLTSQGKLPVTNDYKVDLNSDSIYDIKISYTSYNNISKRANLKIIKISEDVFTKVDDIQKSVDIVTGTTSDDTTTSKDTTSDIVGNVVDQAKYNFESWIVAVVIIISIIIFVVLIYYYYRNHTKKKIKMLMSTMPTY